MDWFARSNLDDLRRLVQGTACKAWVEFLNEGLIFTGKESPVANLMLSLISDFDEFERSLIRNVLS